MSSRGNSPESTELLPSGSTVSTVPATSSRPSGPSEDLTLKFLPTFSLPVPWRIFLAWSRTKSDVFFGCPMKIGIYKLFGVFPICGQNSGDTVMMCQNISSTFWALWPILRNIPGESHNQIPHHKWCLRPMTFIVSRCRQLLQRASAITLKKWIEKG